MWQQPDEWSDWQDGETQAASPWSAAGLSAWIAATMFVAAGMSG